MAFNLKKLQNATRPGKLTFPDGSELNLNFRPNAYTPDHEDIVDQAKESGKSGDTLKAMMVPLIESWDIVDEVERRDPETGKIIVDAAGEIVYDLIPVPVSEEGLGHLPFKVLGDIMDIINKDVSPGEVSSSNSSGSFG